MKKIMISAVAALSLVSCVNTSSNNANGEFEDSLDIIEVATDEAIVSSVPDDAELLAEDELTGMKAYVVNLSVMHDGDGETLSEFWLEDKDGNAKKMFTTNEEWQDMDWETPKKYPITQIMAVDKADFIYNKVEKKTYIVLSGCPDARNEFVYLMPASFDSKEALFLCCADGYFGFDDDSQHILGGSYGYHEEGGRYGILKEMDFNGKVLEKNIIEDENYMQ